MWKTLFSLVQKQFAPTALSPVLAYYVSLDSFLLAEPTGTTGNTIVRGSLRDSGLLQVSTT